MLNSSWIEWIDFLNNKRKMSQNVHWTRKGASGFYRYFGESVINKILEITAMKRRKVLLAFDITDRLLDIFGTFITNKY